MNRKSTFASMFLLSWLPVAGAFSLQIQDKSAPKAPKLTTEGMESDKAAKARRSTGTVGTSRSETFALEDTREALQGSVRRATEIKDSYLRNTAVTEIICRQAAAGYHDDAKANVEALLDDKRMGLGCIVSAQVKRGFYEPAKGTAGLIENLEARVILYNSIAVAEAGAGRKDEALSTFQLALRDALDPQNAELRRFTVPVIAVRLAEAGFFDEALTTARLAPDEQKKDAFKWIGTAEAQAGNTERARSAFQEASSLISRIRDNGSRDSALCRLVDAQADAGLVDDALATSRMIWHPNAKTIALNYIHRAQSKSGRR